MPPVDELPTSIAVMARQNAAIVGVLHDFDTHMHALLPKIEAILGSLITKSVVAADQFVVDRTCRGIIQFLQQNAGAPHLTGFTRWETVSSTELQFPDSDNRVTLLLHRLARVAELLELHVLLSFWSRQASMTHVQAGLVMHLLEQSPVLPDECFSRAADPYIQVKIRRSDEDPREIWKMITPSPLQLSIAYVATVSTKPGIAPPPIPPPDL